MNRFLQIIALLPVLLNPVAKAELPTVFEATVNKPMSEVYAAMQASFDESGFYVFYELDIGGNLSNFSEKWGDQYNQSGLSAIRSIVFCNGWYANQASNMDPTMLGLCPLHMTLIEKDGKTTALFNRPTVIAKGSPAYDLFVEIEQEVINIIKIGMQ